MQSPMNAHETMRPTYANVMNIVGTYTRIASNKPIRVNTRPITNVVTPIVSDAVKANTDIHSACLQSRTKRATTNTMIGRSKLAQKTKCKRSGGEFFGSVNATRLTIRRFFDDE